MYIHICRHTHVCAYVEREKGSKRREEKKEAEGYISKCSQAESKV